MASFDKWEAAMRYCAMLGEQFGSDPAELQFVRRPRGATHDALAACCLACFDVGLNQGEIAWLFARKQPTISLLVKRAKYSLETDATFREKYGAAIKGAVGRPVHLMPDAADAAGEYRWKATPADAMGE